MSILFAFSVSDPERLCCALHPWRSPLRVPSERTGDGWGLGFYQGGEVLLKKQPLASEDGDLDFYARAKGLKSNILVGHVREATIGARRTENTQPFRFRQWVGAHKGTIERFDQIRGELLESTPDFLRRNIRGESDSEHLFHLALAFLHDSGKLDDPRIAPDAAADAVRAAVTLVERAVAAKGGGESEKRDGTVLNFVLSNGRIVVALRRGAPMLVMRRNGVADCPVCRQHIVDMGRGDRPAPHEQLRSVLVLSGGDIGPEAGAEEVPDSAIVMVDESLSVSMRPLRPEDA
ncbi:MAG: class II glutamine amidotransferase [Myxococcota bacterium]|mgnify:CR=1 FL=1